MDTTSQELAKQGRGKEEDDSYKNNHMDVSSSIHNHNNMIENLNLQKLKHYKKWFKITILALFVLLGQTCAVLLGRLYFDKGGNSKWIATIVQTAGFPILIPLKFFFSSSPSSIRRPSISKLALLYFVFGLIVTGDNLMYSYGLSYLPVSTYSLLCSSQLAFNAITAYFINAQKFTMLVVNSVVLLTISACLLAINAKNEGNAANEIARGKYVIGFLCTIGASATYSFLLSLAQFSFEKVIKDNSFDTVLCMQLYPCIVATCGCVVGLFGSGEWRTLKGEMRDYEQGRVPYVMVLVSTAISWQVASVGLLGLINEVSSLFSNVISTLGSPLVPIFAVVLFHDTMNGVKVISLLLGMWGFVSYIYQHYLDSAKAYKASKEIGIESLNATTEIC